MLKQLQSTSVLFKNLYYHKQPHLIQMLSYDRLAWKLLNVRTYRIPLYGLFIITDMCLLIGKELL